MLGRAIGGGGPKKGIIEPGGTIKILGGKVTAENGIGGDAASAKDTSITLGWMNPDDFIKSGTAGEDERLAFYGSVSIASGKAFMDKDDNSRIYSGSLNAKDIEEVSGRTLVPAELDIIIEKP